jgi:hypothetical protein
VARVLARRRKKNEMRIQRVEETDRSDEDRF